MRILLGLIAAAGALGACQSEDDVRTRYRAEKHRECIDGLRQHPDSAKLDIERLCNCVLDRQMAGRSSSELKTFEPDKQQIDEWGVTCAEASLRPDTIKPGQER
jgi:hypothetical protein